jgi:YVTN family beta-propeller protein
MTHTGALLERAVVPIEGGPIQLCAALDGEVIVALPSEGSQLTLLDGRTAEVRGTIEVGRGPWNAIARGALIFVAMHTEPPSVGVDAIQIVDVARCAIVNTVALPEQSRPKLVVPAFEHDVLYSLNWGNATVSQIAIGTAQAVRGVHIGDGPQYAQRFNGVLYVANGLSNDVTMVDESTLAVIGRVPVGRAPERCVVYKDRAQVYTNDLEDDTLTVIDIAARRVVATIHVERGPFRITPWDSRGRDEWGVLCRAGSLQLIDADTHAVTDTVRLPGPPANWNWGLGARHETVYVALANEPTLLVMDAASLRITDTIRLTSQPEGAAFGPGIVISRSGGVFVACEDAVTLLARETIEE